MARAENVSIPPGEVVQLTNADVSGNITIQNSGGYQVRVLGTATDAAPSVEDFRRGLRFNPVDAHPGTIDELFPGAGYLRLWAYSQVGGSVTVYHE